MENWKTCTRCGEEWHDEAFRAAGNAYHGYQPICAACFEESYPRRKVACCGCGRRMQTRGHSPEPTCRPCRRGKLAATRCTRCGRDARRWYVDHNGECFRCYNSGRDGLRRIQVEDGSFRLREDTECPALTRRQQSVLEEMGPTVWRRVCDLPAGDRLSCYLPHLVRYGWLERKRVPNDKRYPARVWGYRLTESGQDVLTRNRAVQRERAA